jgi:hypothetical protein
MNPHNGRIRGTLHFLGSLVPARSMDMDAHGHGHEHEHDQARAR